MENNNVSTANYIQYGDSTAPKAYGDTENYTDTTGQVYVNNDHCASRLPCGLCMITQSPCPYVRTTPTITWTALGQTGGMNDALD